MAATLSDFSGWEVIKKDDNGNILVDDPYLTRGRRRARKDGIRENIVLRRLEDKLEIACGDSIVMQEPDLETTTVYMVHEIRLNTMNNVVEIWAFNYLQWFEFDQLEYLKADEEVRIIELGEPVRTTDYERMSEQDLAKDFEDFCNKSEIALTAELSEVYLKYFVNKATVMNPDEAYQNGRLFRPNPRPCTFVVRFACEPDGTSLTAIDIHDLESKIAKLDAKESDFYVKELTVFEHERRLSSYTPYGSQTASANYPRGIANNSITSKNSTTSKSPTASATRNGKPKSNETKEKVEKTDKKNAAEYSDSEFLQEDYYESESSSFDEGDAMAFGYYNLPRSVMKRYKISPPNLYHHDTRLVFRGSGENVLGAFTEQEWAHRDDMARQVRAKGTAGDQSHEESKEPETQAIATSQKRTRAASTDPPLKDSKVEEAITASPVRRRSPRINSTATAGTVKKYTKKNVSRAKKAYTPFSKRFKKIDDIPDLTKLAEFNQDQIDLDIAAIENRLRSPKKQHTVETIFSKVKQQLYTSQGKDEIMKATNFDEYLPARENEFASIYLSLYSAIEAGTGTTIYVAGTPGVGKTLTVREVVKELLQSVDQDELPKFQYVEINGLKMIKPTDSYEVLWNKISGERLTSGAAMESLEFYFNKVPKNKKRPILVLLDELDALVTKSQDVMYNFFNWTTYSNAKLVVIAVANTMDLPERQLGNKVSSRIGFTRIMFTGYNFEELKTIINLRLKGLNESHFFVDTRSGSARMLTEDEEEPELDTTGMQKVKLKISPDAIEIASRKIASVSGDARRALKACKRAVEIAEHEYMEKNGYGYDGIESRPKSTPFDDDEHIQKVEVRHIIKALNETVNSPVVQFLTNLSFTSKLFLHAMISLIRKTGNHEQPLGDIVDEIRSSIEANGKNKYVVEMQRVLFNQDTDVSMEQLRIISWEFLVNQLIEAGIIIRQNLKNERLSAVKFNVSIEDVKSALEKDKVMKTL